MKRLARFALVGGGGFAVDAAVLLALADAAGWDPLSARLVSAVAATLATWLLNRLWTFKERRSDAPVREFAVYAGVVGLAACVNIAVYASVLHMVPALRDMLLIPLAAGAAAGFAVNYWGASRAAFPEPGSPGAAAPRGSTPSR